MTHHLHRLTLIIAACCCFFLPKANAHQNIVENDTTVCPGNALTFHGIGSTPISLAIDDAYSGIIPIGFNFNFYGTSFNKCVISSNGFITFDTTQAGLFSNWSITSGIPGNVYCKNSVCGHYSDIYPVIGGTIDYVTVGNAPNRSFVVSFCSIPMYSCTTLLTTFQIVLHESSNLIDVHLRDKPTCTTWNNGAGIEGVQNYDATLATVVPGRNYPGTWTASMSSHQFTATSATAYTVASIPFAPIATSGNTFAWTANTKIGTPFATTQNITVTPTVNTTYYLREIHCQDTTFDSVKVTIGGGGTITSAVKTNPSVCGGTDGYITLGGLPANATYTLHYTKGGVAQPPLTITTSPTGTFVLNNLMAGTYANIYLVAIGNGCPTNTVGPFQLSSPSLTANFNPFIRYGCSADTVHFINLSLTPGAIHFQWSFGDGTGDTARNPVHLYPIQASYTVRLIATNGYCTDTAVQTIDLTHPIHAAFTVDHDSACSHQTVTFTNTSIVTSKNGINPKYAWSFGDGTSDTTQNPTHAFLNSGVYHVRMIVKNFVPCYDTAYHTIVVDSIPFAFITASDTALCSGKAITFTGHFLAIGNIGYDWSFSDGGHSNSANPIQHSFDSTGTYAIKLTAHYRLCPDTSYSEFVNIFQTPTIDLGPDTSLCPGGAPIVLVDALNAVNPLAHHLWNTGDTTAYITVNNTGLYSETVSVHGCTASDSVLVSRDCYIEIPNSFSPNNDGQNDYFLPRQYLSRSVVSFKMSIFDRWGEQVFQTVSIDGRGWDGKFNGKDQPTGAYIYIMDVSFSNGKKEHYTGNVTLLR